MRNVVTLDPEYIPWEPHMPTVRLRRSKHNKLAGKVVYVLLLALMLGGVWVYFNRATLFQSSGTPTEVDGATAASITSEGVLTATVAPSASVGQLGRLTVWTKDGVTFYDCETYAVFAGAEIVAMGETTTAPGLMFLDDELVDAIGPVVDIRERRRVEVVCDNQKVN